MSMKTSPITANASQSGIPKNSSFPATIRLGGDGFERLVRTATRHPAIPPSRRRGGRRLPSHDTMWAPIGPSTWVADCLTRYRQGVPALNGCWTSYSSESSSSLGLSRRNVAAARANLAKDTTREMEAQRSPMEIMLWNVCSVECQPSDHSMTRPMAMPSTYHATARLNGDLDSQSTTLTAGRNS